MLDVESSVGGPLAGFLPGHLTTVPAGSDRNLPDRWLYPKELADDLKGVDLPAEVVQEALTCAWEFVRCVIPHWTNWERYIAFARTIVISIIVEFRGDLVDMLAGDRILGYDLEHVLDAAFAGTRAREPMGPEFRSFLLVTADKTGNRRGSELFRRYVDALARSPRDWFRMRDCDGLARFTMAGALACNDFDDVWFSDDEWQILAEVADGLYDAVAFHKHRAEGETNNTFAYLGAEARTATFRRYREVLWALDVAWAQSPLHRCLVNFLRNFGGPIHMTMRRYRFVEDGLMVGRPETEAVVTATRQNFKLWNRNDAMPSAADHARYAAALAQREKLMFPGLADLLQNDVDRCDHCRFRRSYGAETSGQFGGVQLCDRCRARFQAYAEDIVDRAAKVFPELRGAALAHLVGLEHGAD